MKKLFAALKTRHFLKHLGFAFLTSVILFFGIKWFLMSYTHQGEAYRVDLPNLVGLTMNQVEETLGKLGLEHVISDTVFSEKGKPGTVLIQTPGPTSETHQKVKKGRKIYLTLISNQPKLVSVPRLKDKSRRHAEGVLRIIGIKAKVKYKASDACNDCVLEQLYQGRVLEEGAKIPKGETVTLLLGQKSGERVPVVDLTGLTIDAAQQRLSNSSLTMVVLYENCKNRKDSASAVIYKQSHNGGEVAAGTEITVWASNDNK